jgi:hypothetical protein
VNTKIAQAISLQGFGNAFFRGMVPREMASRMVAAHSTFKNVKGVSFVRYRGNWRVLGRSFAIHDIGEWLTILTDRGTNEIKLGICAGLPAVASEYLDRILCLEAKTRESVQIWRPSWRLARSPGSNERIWEVDYQESSQQQTTVPEFQVDQATRNLQGALEKIKAFAVTHNLDAWGESFSAALASISDSDPIIPYFPDLLPETLHPTLAVRRLLSGAFTGWVFGGMGTWNDIATIDEIDKLDYQVVTNELHTAICRAILAAANNI